MATTGTEIRSLTIRASGIRQKGPDIRRIDLVGHDRGARVATRFPKDHPDAIDRLVVMDNVPTRIIARDFDAQKAKAYWSISCLTCPRL